MKYTSKLFYTGISFILLMIGLYFMCFPAPQLFPAYLLGQSNSGEFRKLILIDYEQHLLHILDFHGEITCVGIERDYKTFFIQHDDMLTFFLENGDPVKLTVSDNSYRIYCTGDFSARESVDLIYSLDFGSANQSDIEPCLQIDQI